MPIAKPVLPQLQRGHPLARGVIAAWPFYEGSGKTLTNIADPRGTSTVWAADNPLILPNWQGGPFGSCLNTDKTGSHVYIKIPEWFSTLSPPFTLFATATNVRGSAFGSYTPIVLFRGGATAMGVFIGNSNNRLSGYWTASSSEYDAQTGITPPTGVPFSVAMVITATLFTLHYYDPTSGYQTFALAETCNPINLSGGPYSPNWAIGTDGYDTNGRAFPGVIHNIVMAGYAASRNEFMAYAADPFAVYRPRSHVWLVPAGPPTFHLQPDSDDSRGGWVNQAGGTSNIFQAIDETSADDADYIVSPSVAVATRDLTVRLLQGGTTIATWTESNIDTTFATSSRTLTGGQVAAITNFNSLLIEFDDNQGNTYRCSLNDPTAGNTLVAPVVVRYRFRKA